MTSAVLADYLGRIRWTDEILALRAIAAEIERDDPRDEATLPLLRMIARKVSADRTDERMSDEEEIIRGSIDECPSDDVVARVRARWESLWRFLEPDHPFRLILADAIEKRRAFVSGDEDSASAIEFAIVERLKQCDAEEDFKTEWDYWDQRLARHPNRARYLSVLEIRIEARRGQLQAGRTFGGLAQQ